MAKARQSLSQEEFDQLVKRAIELDEAGRERLNVSRASQIAREIGIAPDAWEEAMREFADQTIRTTATKGISLKRVAAALASGLVLGVVFGVTDFDGPYAAAVMVAVAAGIVVNGRTRTNASAYADLMSWWVALPAGIMLGAGEKLTDPVWFAGLSFAGSLVFNRVLRAILHRMRPARTGQTVDLT
jgi:hypothetical protein